MAGKQKKPLTTLAIVLALASTSTPIAANSIVRPVLAQSSTETSFPIPKELPSGQPLQIDGSTSMSAINEALEKNFETQYPGTDVKISYQGTDTALQALREGKIDLAAIGRPLTSEEQEQGLVAVPVTRHKIAIIVGKDNQFNNSITAQQFARIYRGEISDWSEVGGEAGKIRVVDRPDNSDTRQSFPKYAVFNEEGSFSLSSNNQKISEDSTQAVIDNLGKDGIGYAIADQVVNNPNARIVVMHNVLPDSPRYPFSQPLIYVYNKSRSTPAILAFLGTATTAQNQQLIEQARVAGAIGAIAGSAITSTTTTPPATLQPHSVSTPITPPETIAQPGTTTQPEATAGAVAAEESKDGGISPWWWLLLLPLLGGLLWWLLKGRSGGGAAVIPPVIPTATNQTRIVLTPRNCRDAYAYWEVPDRVKQEMRRQGGQKMKLRLYDVTDLNIDRQTPHSVKEFDCSEQQQDLHLPIARDDRDYIAELGYLTSDNRWLSVIRSTHVRVPACAPTTSTIPETAAVDAGVAAPSEVPDSKIPDLATGALGTAAAAAAIAAGAGLAGTVIQQQTSVIPINQENRLILVPKNAQDAYAYWEISPEKQTEVSELGDGKLLLRLYDTTGDIDLDKQPAHCVREYECDNQNPDLHIAVPQIDRDYTAELGYVAKDGKWVKIARSLPVQINSEVSAPTDATGTELAEPTIQPEFITPVTLDDRLILVSEDSQNAEAAWEISPEKHREIQQLGGQKLLLRLYDITEGIDDLDPQPLDYVQEYECDEQQSNLQIPIPQTDRDYIAEIGYLTDYGQWLKIARSAPVEINSPVTDNEISPVAATGALGVAAATGVGLVEALKTPAIQENSLTLVPQDSQNAEATWEISPEKHAEIQQLGGQKFVLYLYDVTGEVDLDLQPANSEQQYDCDEHLSSLQIAIPESDRDYIAEIGYLTDYGQWLQIARSLPVRIGSQVAESEVSVPAEVGLADAIDENNHELTPTIPQGQVTLTVLDAKNADARWEMSETQQAELKEAGKKLLLRVDDITENDLDFETANCVQEYECDPNSTNVKIVIPQSDRDYIAKIGYIDDGKWVTIARSASLRVIGLPTESDRTTSRSIDNVTNVATNVVEETSQTVPNLTGDLAKAIGAAVSGGVAAVAELGTTATTALQTPPESAAVTITPEMKRDCRIILVPYSAQNAYAFWEVSEDYKEALRKQGGKNFMLRVHDATGLDVDYQPPHHTQEYLCEETQQDKHVSVPVSDRDYIAEVGYYTEDGRWLRLIRSFHVRVPLEGKSK